MNGLLGEAIELGVGAALRQVGVAPEVAGIVARAVPKLIALVESAIGAGKDPDAELAAALDAVDVAADAVEARKFPDG